VKHPRIRNRAQRSRAAIEDTAAEARDASGNLVAPNLGVAACSRFAASHRQHGDLKYLVLDDDHGQGWIWTQPLTVRNV
jgi:hypothetical protein